MEPQAGEEGFLTRRGKPWIRPESSLFWDPWCVLEGTRTCGSFLAHLAGKAIAPDEAGLGLSFAKAALPLARHPAVPTWKQSAGGPLPRRPSLQLLHPPSFAAFPSAPFTLRHAGQDGQDCQALR